MKHSTAAPTLSVNGATLALPADPSQRLSTALREIPDLRGTKVGCDAGDCGACTVLLDGAPVCACMTPVAQAIGREVTTVEGLSADGISALQAAFLRHGAAQCGICTPGMLMAAVALLEREPHPSRAAAEEAIGGVLCRCTGYQKIIDAICDVDGAEVPAPPTGPAVGASFPRLDGAPKVLGTEVFGADHVPEGCLSVRAIRSPHPHAAFAFGDVQVWAEALGLRVFTADDIPGRNQFGVIPGFEDQPVLAASSTLFEGEAVALVVGPPEVVDALDLADFPITWDPVDPLMTTDAAKTGDRLHSGREGNLLIRGFVTTGDPDGALAEAAHVAEATMETAFVEHAYIEPEAGVAWMDGETLVLQACTQAPIMDRNETAVVLGLPKERVRIVPAAAGGGFGAKIDLSVQPLIGLAAIKTGKPCRMVFSRKESMQSTTKRHPGKMVLKAGVDGDGLIKGFVFDGEFNTGAYASWGPTVANRVPVHASGPYKTPDYRAEARAIHPHGPVSGAFRGFGVPQAAILQERVYDQLAEAAGIDRMEFRRRNALVDGDRTVCGQELSAVGMRPGLDALLSHWKEAISWKSHSPDRGIGIASCWYGCGNTGLPNPSTVRAGITGDGRVMLHQGATDIGQGSNTVIPQIFAEALGVDLGVVEIVGPDTSVTPDCGKTSASRQTFVTGRAAEAAGKSLRAELLRHANAGEDAVLGLEAGALTVGGARRIELADLPENGLGYVFSAEETYDPPITGLDENGQGKPYAVYGYGAQIARVEVDRALGTVKVEKIIAAHDLGRVINPLLAEGQIHGGIAQGLGMALMEEFIPGRTANLHDYLIPTSGDMPEIEVILLEVPDPEGPMGAKGLGEHALIPTAPAILNAIRDATGAEINQLPALPHRVLEAIRNV